MLNADWDIACHGYRWLDYQFVEEAIERAHIEQAIELHTKIVGSKPLGWYTGRDSPNTRRLILEHDHFLYDSDSYADDLPYWVPAPQGHHLVIPYTLDTNDMRFAAAQGFNSGDQFFSYLKDAFDALYAEGADAPKMLNVGLHCRIIGRPARIQSLRRFIEYVLSHSNVWVPTRLDIAKHWHRYHPPSPEQANYRIRFSARSIRIIRSAAFVTEKEKVEITTAGKNDHSLIVSAIAIPITPASTTPK